MKTGNLIYDIENDSIDKIIEFLKMIKKELQEYTLARNFITEKQNIDETKINIYKDRDKPVFDTYDNLLEKQQNDKDFVEVN